MCGRCLEDVRKVVEVVVEVLPKVFSEVAPKVVEDVLKVTEVVP